MIVTCTSCQARFRIADEKIGPKGAKVRCSKCKNVFVARPAADAGEARAPSFAEGFPVAAAGPGGGAFDPFAAGQPDPFADPFAPPQAGAPGLDTFAPPEPPLGSSAGGHDLPVTDLSDLSGGAAAAPSPAGLTSLAPPLPAAPAPPPAAGQGEAAGAVANADDLVLEEPSRAIPVGPPPLPTAAPAFDFGMGAELAEPSPGEPAGMAPSFEFGVPGTDLGGGSEPASGLELAGAGGAAPGGSFGADPFAAAGAAAPFGAENAGDLGGLRIPTITEPIQPEKAGRPPPQLAVPPRRKAGVAPGAGPLSAPAARSRVQGFLASAVSLAALLAVAAGLLSWWLRDGAADAGGRGPVVAAGVRGGLYETAAGPVLFVRGEVRSRSDRPLGRVAVRAEVLLGGEVRARAEGLAGALPTPEEVAQIAGPEDAARLRARVASRAPQRLEAGASLPFLVTFDAVPEGLPDAVFRVVAEARPAGPARGP